MIYSDSPLSSVLSENQLKYVPFTAFVSILPTGSKRQEIIHSMENIATRVGNALQDDIGTEDFNFDIAFPIAFTPGFGNNPPRLTITGHAKPLSTYAGAPVGTRLVVTDNQELTGPTCANASNKVPDPTLIAVAKSLMSSIKTACTTAGFSNCKIIKLEVSGYIFGVKGTTLPNY